MEAQTDGPSPEDAGAMVRALTDAWLDNHEAALTALSELESRTPSASVYAAMADIYADMGRDLDALNALERAADVGSDPLPYRIMLGDLQLKQGRHSEAQTTYQAVLDQDQDNVGSLLGLARIAEARGDVVEARDFLDRANASSPTLESLNLAAELESGATLQEQSTEPVETPEPDDSIPPSGETVEEALRRLDDHPQDVEAWKAALDALAVNPNPRAVSVAEDALLLFPGRPELVIPAAEVLVENDRKAEAIAAVEPFLDDAGVDMEYRSRAQDIIASHLNE